MRQTLERARTFISYANAALAQQQQGIHDATYQQLTDLWTQRDEVNARGHAAAFAILQGVEGGRQLSEADSEFLASMSDIARQTVVDLYARWRVKDQAMRLRADVLAPPVAERPSFEEQRIAIPAPIGVPMHYSATSLPGIQPQGSDDLLTGEDDAGEMVVPRRSGRARKDVSYEGMEITPGNLKRSRRAPVNVRPKKQAHIALAEEEAVPAIEGGPAASAGKRRPRVSYKNMEGPATFARRKLPMEAPDLPRTETIRKYVRGFGDINEQNILASRLRERSTIVRYFNTEATVHKYRRFKTAAKMVARKENLSEAAVEAGASELLLLNEAMDDYIANPGDLDAGQKAVEEANKDIESINSGETGSISKVADLIASTAGVGCALQIATTSTEGIEPGQRRIGEAIISTANETIDSSKAPSKDSWDNMLATVVNSESAMPLATIATTMKQLSQQPNKAKKILSKNSPTMQAVWSIVEDLMHKSGVSAEDTGRLLNSPDMGDVLMGIALTVSDQTTFTQKSAPEQLQQRPARAQAGPTLVGHGLPKRSWFDSRYGLYRRVGSNSFHLGSLPLGGKLPVRGWHRISGGALVGGADAPEPTPDEKMDSVAEAAAAAGAEEAQKEDTPAAEKSVDDAVTGEEAPVATEEDDTTPVAAAEADPAAESAEPTPPVETIEQRANQLMSDIQRMEPSQKQAALKTVLATAMKTFKISRPHHYMAVGEHGYLSKHFKNYGYDPFFDTLSPNFDAPPLGSGTTLLPQLSLRSAPHKLLQYRNLDSILRHQGLFPNSRAHSDPHSFFRFLRKLSKKAN